MIWDKEFKQKVLKNEFLFSFAAFVENLRYFFQNSKSYKGRNNLLKKGKETIFRKVKFRIKGNNNLINVGNKCRFRNVLFEIFGNNNTIEISDKVTFMEKGYFLIEGDNCKIKIGESTLFRNGKLFAGESNTNIEIGDDCFCGVVTFSTSDFHSVLDLSTGKRTNPPSSISIGRSIWITHSVSIVKGAIISDNSIVAPGSLINKKFLQKNVILAGQPAKIVKENISWTREKLPY